MLRISTITKLNANPVISSGLVLSFALLGDTFLYPVLPLHGAALGVPVVWIGLLLSINRFVRLLANPVFAYLFSKVGFRKLTILAASFSILTTILYGLTSMLSIWLLGRLVWGLCFSVLRISSIYYSSAKEKSGTSLGINRSLQEIGPLLALLLGPLLLEWTNPKLSFVGLGLLTLPALYFAYRLPELALPTLTYKLNALSFPSIFNLLTFFSALIIEGILVVVISKLLINEYISVEEITFLAALYLLYRRVCVLVFSPVSGWLADRWGLHKLFTYALLLSAIGLVLTALDFTQAGIVLCFTFGAVSSALSPAGAIKDTTNRLKDIAANTTSRDLGAALGALLGGLLLNQVYLQELFALSAFLLGFLVLYYHFVVTSSVGLKQSVKWK